MKLTVTRAEDVVGRFLSVTRDGSQVVSYVARVEPTVEHAGPAFALYDRDNLDAERLGFVHVGDTVTLADDKQIGVYVEAAVEHFAPQSPRRPSARAALLPAAAVFAIAFLAVVYATGNTGILFLTQFSPVSQLLMPLIAGAAAGFGVHTINSLSYRRARRDWIRALDRQSHLWAGRRAQAAGDA